MSSLAMNIALSALRAQQQNLDVTGQNIANASTDGYSRQRTVLETGSPWPVPGMSMASGPGQFGTGVEVRTVERIRDQFLDQQLRQQNLLKGEWQQRCDALSQVQTAFNEISDTGIKSALGKFWDAWNELVKYPDSLPVRTTVAETANTLADTIRQIDGELQTLRSDLNQSIGLKVSQINDYLNQIADLNKQISIATVSGLSPNDLLDRRDSLLDDLSKVAQITVTTQADNSITVQVGGLTAVQGGTVTMLKAVADTGINSDSSMYARLQLGDDPQASIPLSRAGGELQGLFEARDIDLQGYMDSLNELASNLAEQVNRLHMSGYGLGGETGIPFFVGSNDAQMSLTSGAPQIGAASIYVNPYITQNPGRIAASDGMVKSSLTTEGSLDPASQQVITLNLGAKPVVADSGQLQVTVAADGLTGTAGTIGKVTFTVAVDSDDSADEIITKIYNKLNTTDTSDSDYSSSQEILNFFNISQSGSSISLQAKAAATNDSGMYMSVQGIVYSGDNGNAQALSQLQDQTIAIKDAQGSTMANSTLDSYYQSMISRLGVDTSHAGNMVTNQEALVTQLTNQKQSVSGVSMDEEMANLITYQTAYQASAKLINVVDSMMQTVIGLIR